MVLNPLCFIVNSLALGDVIATAPSIKWAIENIYKNKGEYIVVAKKAFRPIFNFVPDENFRDFDQKENNWGVPKGFAFTTLNQKKDFVVRNTPKHMHLSQFGCIKMTDRILPNSDLEYLPLPSIDIKNFNLPDKYVVFISSYRDETRAWHADFLLETAKYVKNKGYEPVFVGKTDTDIAPHLISKTSLPETLPFGIDLRNKTDISELASIMSKASAVCGLDSGPIHLAGTTSVPIVCGYTSVAAEYRVPIRSNGITYSITPNLPCISCESKWGAHFWNFENCYLKHIDCCKHMTADKFIEHLDKIL